MTGTDTEEKPNTVNNRICVIARRMRRGIAGPVRTTLLVFFGNRETTERAIESSDVRVKCELLGTSHRAAWNSRVILYSRKRDRYGFQLLTGVSFPATLQVGRYIEHGQGVLVFLLAVQEIKKPRQYSRLEIYRSSDGGNGGGTVLTLFV